MFKEGEILVFQYNDNKIFDDYNFMTFVNELQKISSNKFIIVPENLKVSKANKQYVENLINRLQTLLKEIE